MVHIARIQIIVFGVIAIIWAGLSTQIVLYKSILGVKQFDVFLYGRNISQVSSSSYSYMGVEGIITSFLHTLAIVMILIGSFSSMIDLIRTQIFAKIMLTYSEIILLFSLGFSIASSALDPKNPKMGLDIVSSIIFGLLFVYIFVYLVLLFLYKVEEKEEKEEKEEIVEEVIFSAGVSEETKM